LVLWQIVLLAVVQGVTEFLPISSSGHLVIVAAAMGCDVDIKDVNIVLHFGTLLSILVFFWHRIWRLFGEDRRTILTVIVGTLPAAVIGLTIAKKYSYVLEDPLLAGFMLMVTGSMLWLASRWEVADGEYQTMSLGQAAGIGLAQSIALLPGISRSGSTITTGMALGLSRRAAATFSFLLAIPAIGGGALLECKDILESPSPSTPLPVLAVGATISFVVGLFSLWWLLRLLERGRLEYFAYWCIPVGLGVVVWQLAF
jgi:undecaprenyl-diphosphatase